MTSVTVGGPGLVAVGSTGTADELFLGEADAAVWTSHDGLVWSRLPHDEALLGQGTMNSVTAGAPGLVAVGEDKDDAAMWTSVDGFTWSRVPHDEAVFGGPDLSSINFDAVSPASMASVTSGGPVSSRSVLTMATRRCGPQLMDLSGPGFRPTRQSSVGRTNR